MRMMGNVVAQLVRFVEVVTGLIFVTVTALLVKVNVTLILAGQPLQ